MWKANGDELIFVSELSNRWHCESLINVFIEIIKKYDTNIRSRSDQKLGIKGTSWLAGFPVINHEVMIAFSKGDDKPDFIGPSIDIGFRLTKHSTTRKFVISVELAHLLCDSHDGSSLTFCSDGLHELKGVLSGVGYPIIWIDMRKPDFRNIDNFIKINEIEKQTLRDASGAFISKYGNHDIMCLPYIVKIVDSKIDYVYGTMNPEHRNKLENLNRVTEYENEPQTGFDQPSTQNEGLTELTNEQLTPILFI